MTGYLEFIPQAGACLVSKNMIDVRRLGYIRLNVTIEVLDGLK